MKHKILQYHCARLCETFDNRLFSARKELAGTTNNKHPERMINERNNNISFELLVTDVSYLP